MTAVAVAADNVRFDAMDALTNITDIGGGAGSGLEPDIYYSSAAATPGDISRKVGTAQRGFGSTGAASVDMTAARRKTALFKTAITNDKALDPQSTPGKQLRVGSGTGAYYAYDLSLVAVSPTRGGFIFSPIDPNVAGYRDGTTGSPVLTAVAWLALAADFSATSISANVIMTALDVGAGLNLTGGDGADPDGDFDDFVSHDEGTVANRYGYVSTNDGILFIYGKLWIGQNTSQASVATVFTDAGKVLVFPDGLFDAGYSGLGIDLGDASSVVTLTDCVLVGRGDETTADTRPDLDGVGTAGAATLDGCTFDTWANIVLTAGFTLKNGKVINSEAITQAGAAIEDMVFSGATTADGVAFLIADDPAKIKRCGFTFSDGHGIEISATGTFTFEGNTFTGYGAGGSNDAAIYNNSGGAVTLNITGGGSTPTVRNGAGASTTIVNNTQVTYTGLEPNTEVRIYDSGDGSEIAGVENSGTSFVFSDAAGNSVDVVMISIGFEIIRQNGFTIPSSDTSIPVQQRAERNYSNPA